MSNIIDLSYLQEISGGDASFIKEMLELYINTTAQEANLFNDLLQRNDWEGIGHLAHKMKAPIQMLGANDLFNTIRTIENNGKNGTDLHEMPALIEKVQALVKESITEIEALIPTL